MTARDVYLKWAARQAGVTEGSPNDPITAAQGAEIIDMLKVIVALQRAILEAIKAQNMK